MERSSRGKNFTRGLISVQDLLTTRGITAVRSRGPVLRITKGDRVDVHLIKDVDVAHGLDIHAAELAPNNTSRKFPVKGISLR